MSSPPSSAFENHLVVQLILSHFSTKELLELSTVNKFWNSEARTLLRKHRKCEAFIAGPVPCLTAKLLNDMITDMKIVPFNALSVEIQPHDCPLNLKDSKLHEVYSSFVTKFDLKYLRINWPYWHHSNTKGCILGQLLLRFMSGSARLERLQIDEMPLHANLESENRPSQQSIPELPKLTNLKLPHGELTKLLTCNFFQELIDRKAPNLQVLENELTPCDPEKLPQRIFELVRNLILPPTRGGIHENVKVLHFLERIIQSIHHLASITIRPPVQILDPGWDLNKFWNLVRQLLDANKDTLESVNIDPYSIAALNVFGLDRIRLQNVAKLSVPIREVERGIRDVLLQVPMQNIFPSVAEVVFSVDENVRSFPQPPSGDDPISWPTVTNLVVEGSPQLNHLLPDLATLFPCLESLVIPDFFIEDLDGDPDVPPFQLIWTNWPRLQYLGIGTSIEWQITTFDVNCDAEFCGIYPEEAELLREKDEDFLKSVHIVPIFPAINQLKDLREAKIKIGTRFMFNYDDDEDKEAEKDEDEDEEEEEEEEDDDDGDSKTKPKLKPPDGSFFLSKVTFLVAIRQLKHFKKFHLIADLQAPRLESPYLEHLKPWVEVEGLK